MTSKRLKNFDYSEGAFTQQGAKLKKSSGHLLATNWRKIVARGKFLVASL